MNIKGFDKIIIGGGLYGLYAALHCAKRGNRVLVIEKDRGLFQRATYINQARVHMGYHYPRSISTAEKSFRYFERFFHDYEDCIWTDFEQIYAISTEFSYTNGMQFKKFCDSVGIFCEEISTHRYFKDHKVEAAFRTKEYTYDANMLLKKLLAEINVDGRITILTHVQIKQMEERGNNFELVTSVGIFRSGFILNASYAATNQIIRMLGYDKFDIKYELCEIIICKVNDALKHIGLTVMDGPFFSIMPFGKSSMHSLTSVTFTPHDTCYEPLPLFDCQNKCEKGYCTPVSLGNCNRCQGKPQTAWPYMNNLAKKYMNDELKFFYNSSLFSMKPVLKSAEIDDSRPTVIRVNHTNPTFVSVLSGKINTIYDLAEVLDEYE